MAQDREAAIRRRAHEIRESEGRPDGHRGRHWAQARSEVEAPEDGVATTAEPPRAAPEDAPMRAEAPAGLRPSVAASNQTGAVIGAPDEPPRAIR